MVESNIRRGTIRLERIKYMKPTFTDNQKVIERTVIQRVISSSSEFHFDEYETLMLDGTLIPEILFSDKLFLESFPKLMALSMNACGLRTLEGFPKLPNLRRLELQDNKLTSIVQLIHYRKLENLKLTNNYLTTESALKPITGLRKLNSLFLTGNPICDLLDHAVKVF